MWILQKIKEIADDFIARSFEMENRLFFIEVICEGKCRWSQVLLGV